MKKTLLLVFIHGFKGGDDTFARFPPHLRALLSHALPHLNILQIQYPKFETRGDLAECVANFKEWLQNKVIDLEVAQSTPSPTIDPGVRVILIGHSMGGIVGAETILTITRDTPIPRSSSPSKDKRKAEEHPSTPPFMFPSILGLLAFDTPYLGISPGVLAHGAETHYQTVRGAWSAYNSVTNAFGLGASNASAKPAASTIDASKALPAASSGAVDAAAVPAWQKWGRYAMYAGAAGAVLAGGAAAYANRGQISEGWGWATSHLEFIGCLAKGAQLESRIGEIIDLNKNRAMGFRNLYTRLGGGAGTLSWNDSDSARPGGGWAHSVVGSERTFCLLPKNEATRAYFEPSVNEKAGNEIGAHMNMFTPKDNPGYYVLSERAKDIISEWVRNGWHVPETALSSETDGGAVDEDPEIVYKEEVEGQEAEQNPWSS